MKIEKLRSTYIRLLYVGIVCMIFLTIASFLPGIEGTKYTMVGDTWGFEYYKEITFIRHNLRMKSLVQFLWVGLLIAGIGHCIKGHSERDSQIEIIFMSAILGLVLLVRTYDFANNPSKLVFTNQSAKRIEHNIAASKTINETSVLGFKARIITYDRSFPLGNGFWFMLVVVAVQLLIAIKLWNIESQIEVIESQENKRKQVL